MSNEIATDKLLLIWIERAKILAPDPEFEFSEARKWKFDFAWPKAKVYIELEGGISDRKRGRHIRAAGYRNDLDKYNSAAADGWLGFRFCSQDVQENSPIMQKCLSAIRRQVVLWEHARRS